MRHRLCSVFFLLFLGFVAAGCAQEENDDEPSGPAEIHLRVPGMH